VNPYELARLASNLGTTTTDVIARFTTSDGVALTRRPDSSCVFLGATGCTVHKDRPLACRLYPLGRIVQADGSETFIEIEPLPGSEGEYGDAGTVGTYLDSQDAEPYFVAADRYYAVVARLLRLAGQSENAVDAGGSNKTSDDDATEGRAPGDDVAQAIDARAFIDAHLAVQEDAKRNGTAMPDDVDGLVEQHLALIERWAEQLR
jgi:Fe-S-cluster containining protein